MQNQRPAEGTVYHELSRNQAFAAAAAAMPDLRVHDHSQIITDCVTFDIRFHLL